MGSQVVEEAPSDRDVESCPECGSYLLHACGCALCAACGYSRCCG